MRNFFFRYIFLFLFFGIVNSNLSYSEINFEKLENKKVSFLDFFLLKFENIIVRRTQVLRTQAIPTRVQYSDVGIKVEYDEKEKIILVKIYSIMDRNRYSKKKYKQKLSDCNQVRNLIFYNKTGYKFFTQKRDPYLSEEVMREIFENVFFDNSNFNEKEINFLLANMFVHVTILNPVNKTELTCLGKVNDYELK